MERRRRERVTSLQNPKVKLAASLARRKHRLEHGLVLVEGPRLLRQALAFAAELLFVLADPHRIDESLLSEAEAAGAEVIVATPAVIERAAATEAPQGLVGVARVEAEDPAFLSEGEWIVVLDRIQDPGNVGAILRSARAAGVDGVVLTQGCADPSHPKAIRASAGAYFGLSRSGGWEPGELAAVLKRRGFEIVGADARGATDAFTYDWGRRHALVVGNEGEGVDPRLTLDQAVHIPMPGGGESLNVAVSAGILLFEALRRRRQIVAPRGV